MKRTGFSATGEFRVATTSSNLEYNWDEFDRWVDEILAISPCSGIIFADRYNQTFGGAVGPSYDCNVPHIRVLMHV